MDSCNLAEQKSFVIVKNFFHSFTSKTYNIQKLGLQVINKILLMSIFKPKHPYPF